MNKLRVEVIFLSKKSNKQDPYFRDNQGVAEVENQLNKKYQKGVVEDKLNNNKSIYTYNNQSK